MNEIKIKNLMNRISNMYLIIEHAQKMNKKKKEEKEKFVKVLLLL
jgi:hypothetical protein